jgi:hypothetical protein
MSFKEEWLREDEHCAVCGAVTKPVTGLNKQNMRRLFIGKPTATDWIFFFIIVMTLFMAYEYNIETAQCRYYINHPDQICSNNGYLTPQNNFSGIDYLQHLNKTSFDITNA